MTKEGTILMGTSHAAPCVDFEESLNEWQHLITQKKAFICDGNFNEDLRNNFLTKHLIVNNLAIAKNQNTVATFKKQDSEGGVVATGWPDLTLGISKNLPNISNCHKSDTHSGFHHKYTF